MLRAVAIWSRGGGGVTSAAEHKADERCPMLGQVHEVFGSLALMTRLRAIPCNTSIVPS